VTVASDGIASIRGKIVNEQGIHGVEVRGLEVFADDRGALFEAFRQEGFPDVPPIVQANISRSKANVLRGMHFHKRQFDVWVPVTGRFHVGLFDVRSNSPTRRTPLTHVLDADEPEALVIPPSVAHGFQALTDVTLLYLVTEVYDGTDEHGFRFDDPELRIEWPVAIPVVSERDRTAPSLDDILAGGTS
jgi:dTDP-4-dehydrorhamnose 3,5-epimerase